MLGDCSIQKNTSKSHSKYRLKILQGKKHKEYIYHLHQEFENYVVSQPFYSVKRKTYSFQTILDPQKQQLPVRKGLLFNTQGFCLQEVKILSENINKAYNLETWVKQNKKKPIIAVSGKKYADVRYLISPYIIESMRYKLPRENRIGYLI